MITRIVEPNEQWRAMQAAAVCFEFPYNAAEEKIKAEAMTAEDIEKAKHPPLPDGLRLPSDGLPERTVWASFSDDEKILYGGLSINAMTAHLEGERVLMGGIGGVCTLPPYRRCGAIRACFEKALPDMYKKGYVLSSLYPFSRAYYRKFGYENGPKEQELTISLSSFRLPDAGGHIRQLLQGDDLSVLTEIYNKFSVRCNCSTYHRKFDPAIEEANLLEQQRYIYVWYDENGEARGFFISKKTDGRLLNCSYTFPLHNAFIALDARAYQALFRFAAVTFAADYDAIRVILPASEKIDSFVSEGNGIRTVTGYNGMMRLVHVRRALELCRCIGTGSIRIQVQDDQIEANCGVWKLDFADGQANRVEKVAEQADIAMSVMSLTSLLCGMRGADELALMPEVQILHEAPFDRVFRVKPCFMMDKF